MVDLVTWRKSRGLSQAQLAKRLGCTQPTVSLAESGRRGPPGNDFILKVHEVTGGAVQPNDFYDLAPTSEAGV